MATETLLQSAAENFSQSAAATTESGLLHSIKYSAIGKCTENVKFPLLSSVTCMSAVISTAIKWQLTLVMMMNRN